MANPYGSSNSPPWKFRPDFGEFVYKRSTDQIVHRNGQTQRRPPHVPADSLAYAAWEGFQYTGSPPTSASGFSLQSGTGYRPPSGQLPVGQTHGQQGQPFQPRNPPAGQSSAQQVTQAIRNYSITPGPQGESSRPQGHVVRTTEFQRNGQNLRHAFDPRRGVATLAATPEQVTGESSRGQASGSRQSRGGRNEDRNVLFPDYRIHPGKFFKVGRVFLVLWAEPAGGGGTVVSRYEVLNQFNERVFSKIRRFVVVREGTQSCSALPITTYGGQGVAKATVVKSDHAIIHTGPNAPDPSNDELPGRGEAPMRSIPIRVDLDNASERLDDKSRINLKAVHYIQHNVKTKSFGCVNRNSLGDLETQFNNVFNKVPTTAGPSTTREQTQNIQTAGPGIGSSGGGAAAFGAAIGAIGGGAAFGAAAAGVLVPTHSGSENDDESENDEESENDNDEDEAEAEGGSAAEDESDNESESESDSESKSDSDSESESDSDSDDE